MHTDNTNVRNTSSTSMLCILINIMHTLWTDTYILYVNFVRAVIIEESLFSSMFTGVYIYTSKQERHS